MPTDHLTRFNALLSEGRIIRNQWTGKREGQETACLLAALSQEVAKAENPSACPASIMPAWLAELTPWMDDNGTDEAWPAMVQRYGKLANRWHVLSEETWKRLGYEALGIIVRDARAQTQDAKVHEVVDRVLALLDRAASGETVSKEEFAVGARAVGAAAAESAESAAWAAAWAVARAVAVAVAAAAVGAACVDRITSGILGIIERECDKAEVSRG